MSGKDKKESTAKISPKGIELRGKEWANPKVLVVIGFITIVIVIGVLFINMPSLTNEKIYVAFFIVLTILISFILLITFVFRNNKKI
jgi:hypothetical protein